ncbi:TPA: hypothetical protein N0F65_009504 [Lagenidium giganteum]|uniref:Uncharacterized protein n=1 Tax=Lagenidium giganteum TaxID=4803 RepID=A0AAV2ZE93_9STRA|nr:TPA: hypothetical protein N0F65_009504 [Lagenidium giganteum]
MVTGSRAGTTLD